MANFMDVGSFMDRARKAREEEAAAKAKAIMDGARVRWRLYLHVIACD